MFRSWPDGYHALHRLSEIVKADPILKDQDVSFDAVNGVVTITGTVGTKGQSDQVADLAKAQPGVRDVVTAVTAKPKAE